MHVIAAKAVAFKEALQSDFKTYQAQVVKNARVMADTLKARGFHIVSGGTDNHLFLVSLVDKGMTGKDAEAALGAANITVNKNTVPRDPASPFITSGLRIGTPAMTTRGFKEAESVLLSEAIANILENINDENVIARVKTEMLALCARFPVYADD